MGDFAWPTTASGAAVAIFFLAFFHKDIRAWMARRGNHPSLPETQSPPQPIQLESALAVEQRHAAEKSDMARSHSETDAKNQKTIERLTASNAAKDAEIARLKGLIPPPEKPFKSRFLPDDEQQ